MDYGLGPGGLGGNHPPLLLEARGQPGDGVVSDRREEGLLALGPSQ